MNPIDLSNDSNCHRSRPGVRPPCRAKSHRERAGPDRRGWAVRTARDEGRLGDPDREQLAYAADNEWILLMFDDDFLSLVEGDGLDHAGITYVQQRDRRIGEVVKGVDAHLEARQSTDRGISLLLSRMGMRPPHLAFSRP